MGGGPGLVTGCQGLFKKWIGASLAVHSALVFAAFRLSGTHSAHSALSAAHARDVEAPAFGKAPAERKYECAVGAAPRERRLGVLRLHPRPNFWSG